MGNKVAKRVLTLAVTGGIMTVGIGSCLGISTSTAIQAGLYYAGLSFILDNDSIFDLFEDGGVTDDALNPSDDE